MSITKTESAGYAFKLPDLESIELLDRAELLAIWPRVMGSEVPRGISQVLLRRFIAFEIQSIQRGGLNKIEIQRLARMHVAGPPRKSSRMDKGTRFLREWNGITHVVELNDAGYVWNAKVYASLSAVAKAITGAHWSGPRFFGVKDRKINETKSSESGVKRLASQSLGETGPASATAMCRTDIQNGNRP